MIYKLNKIIMNISAVELQTTRWRLGLSPMAEVSMAALTNKAASEALKTRAGQPSGPPSQGTLINFIGFRRRERQGGRIKSDCSKRGTKETPL